MNKKLVLIIALQAVLLAVMFWVLVLNSKDEFETYQQSKEETIASPNRVNEKDGVNTVSLPLAVQKNSGISTAKLKEASFKGEIKSLGNVVAIDALVEAKAKLLALKSEIAATRASYDINEKQYQRLKALNDDDKNVSDRSLQEASALLNADKAKLSGAELQIKNLQENVKLKWGDKLSQLAISDKLSPELDKLLNHQTVLIQISLPSNYDTPSAKSSIKVSPISDTSTTMLATYIAPAALADGNGLGKTFYYSAPAEQLRVGMRVNVTTPTKNQAASSGLIIPSSAVVWYAGKPWAYFKSSSKNGQDLFTRKPISTAIELNDGWFNQALSKDDEVVVSGAQLLLSEEFKYLIKNENED